MNEDVTRSALAGHSFLRGMAPGYLDSLAAATTNVAFPAGARIFEEGGFASKFWLIQSGRAALDVPVPGNGRLIVDTVGMGELLGWSWLFPPYRWTCGAVCVTAVKAFELDAAAIRERYAADPLFSYELTGRVLRVVARRLQRTRAGLLARTAAPAYGRRREVAG
jgi:CRP/FNR family transcriptional regulator, cyclic AMP receptor protein